MDVSTLSNVSLPLQIHLVSALMAVALGPVAIYRRRRDIWHKAAGYSWVTAMLTLAVGAFWLDAMIVPFDPYTGPFETGLGIIHLLVFPVAWSLWRGIKAARAGRIAEHQGYMAGLYWQGLLVAGLFTLLPNRTLNRVLFPQMPELGFLTIFLGGAFVFWMIRNRSTAPGQGESRL